MLIGDWFCGGGGVTEGATRAGHKVVFAVNHDKDAIFVHSQNHPDTIHFNEDIREIDPFMILKRFQHLDGWWISAECTHLSNAKGGTSRNADSRTLSDVMGHYSSVCLPPRIWVENVKEIRTNGPLVPKALKDSKGKQRSLELDYCKVQIEYSEATLNGAEQDKLILKHEIDRLINLLDAYDNYKRDGNGELVMVPEPKFKGAMYLKWVRFMQDLGYSYESKVLNYLDYGGAQRRERYFAYLHHKTLGQPIRWPRQTHARKSVTGDLFTSDLKQWRCAREILNLDNKGKCIFTERGDMPLLEQTTLDRMRTGLKMFGHEGEVVMVDRYHTGSSPVDVDGPLPTVMASMERSLVSVSMIDNYTHGQKPSGLNDALGTCLAKREKSLVTAYVMPSSFSNPAVSLLAPLSTVVESRRHLALVHAQYLTNSYGCGGGSSSIDGPLPAVMTNPKSNLTSAFLVKYHGTGVNVIGVDGPISTVCTKDRLGLVNVDFLSSNHGGHNALRWNNGLDEPLQTIAASLTPSKVSALILAGEKRDYVLRHAPKPTAKGNVIHPSWCRIWGGYLVDNAILGLRYRLLEVEELLRAQGAPNNYFNYKRDPNEPLMVGTTKAKWMAGNMVPSDWVEQILGVYEPEPVYDDLMF